MENLKINPLLISKILNLNLTLESSLPYILALYFGYDSPDTPLSTKKTLLNSGIFLLETDKDKKIKSVNWLINPIREVLDPFAWVADWRQKYRDNGGSNAKIGGSLSECVKRMKQVFQLEPTLNEPLVYEITKFYFRNTNKEYIRKPHYFLCKREKGEDKIYPILEWFESYKDQKEDQKVTSTFSRNQMN